MTDAGADCAHLVKQWSFFFKHSLTSPPLNPALRNTGLKNWPTSTPRWWKWEQAGGGAGQTEVSEEDYGHKDLYYIAPFPLQKKNPRVADEYRIPQPADHLHMLLTSHQSARPLKASLFLFLLTTDFQHWASRSSLCHASVGYRCNKTWSRAVYMVNFLFVVQLAPDIWM